MKLLNIIFWLCVEQYVPEIFTKIFSLALIVGGGCIWWISLGDKILRAIISRRWAGHVEKDWYRYSEVSRNQLLKDISDS